MYRGRRIAVVIPAHNESRLLPITLDGLPQFVDQIIVVDDASDDDTAALARGRGEARLEVISHPRNKGVGGAIVTGYQRALTLMADVTVVVGADAQMDPTEMVQLIDPVIDGEADYVKGDRLGHPDVVRRMPWVRLFGNHVLSRLTRLVTGYRVRDSQCGYTAISRAALARLPLELLYPRYGFPNDLLARLAETDARVCDRPVTPIYGEEQSGIRILRVIGPIGWLLARAAGRRLLGRRSAPLALPSVSPRTERR